MHFYDVMVVVVMMMISLFGEYNMFIFQLGVELNVLCTMTKDYKTDKAINNSKLVIDARRR